MSTLADLSLSVKITCRVGARAPLEQQQDWQKEISGRRNTEGYSCTLTYKKRRMTVDFWQGSAHRDEPTAKDVLECLLSDASVEDYNGFEDWASDMGFDEDSRKAEKIYRDVLTQTEKLKKLLGDDYDDFMSAERD
jgi:hypothetical protein